MASWKFYLETFGCKINQYESQLMREHWQKQGGIETSDPAEAHYILINSCAITGRAERNARNAVYRLSKANPLAHIILTGCAAQFYTDFKPRKNANWAMPDQIVPQDSKETLFNVLESPTIPPARMTGISAYNRSRPVIKIQDGCAQKCSYCIVPQTRHAIVARTREEILSECRLLARNGHGELILSGVNLRLYPGGFWPLLAWLDKNLANEFGKNLRLRISSIDPAMLNCKGLEILANCKLVCPHLHLSIQHASPTILKAMNRDYYNADQILAACKLLSTFWDEPGLGADLIAGFPGETEEDLDMLLDFIETAPLTYAHVFPYSTRKGTVAASLPEQIAKKEKENRAWRIRAAINKKRNRFWQAELNRSIIQIACDAPDADGACRAVNERYIPCLLEMPKTGHSPRGLVYARPVGMCETGLLIQSLAEDAM